MFIFNFMNRILVSNMTYINFITALSNHPCNERLALGSVCHGSWRGHPVCLSVWDKVIRTWLFNTIAYNVSGYLRWLYYMIQELIYVWRMQFHSWNAVSWNIAWKTNSQFQKNFITKKSDKLNCYWNPQAFSVAIKNTQ